MRPATVNLTVVRGDDFTQELKVSTGADGYGADALDTSSGTIGVLGMILREAV